MFYFISSLLFVAVVILLLLLNMANKKKEIVEKQADSSKNECVELKKKYNQLIDKYAQAELLAKIVRQSPNAIMLMDEDGNIKSINKGFEDMYGYNFKEFTESLGTNYRQTSFNSDVEARLNWIKETGKTYRYEAPNITKNGAEIWTQTALVPIFDAKGKIANFVTIDTDIHQRVSKSDGIIDKMEQLNLEIDNLTSQFRNVESVSNRLFLRINELFELVKNTDQILQFIQNISHETRILGFNASIEAGRAGEYGASFRVITNKIVDISHDTINSVNEINEILKSINSKQDELIHQKDGSEVQILSYNHLVKKLKTEVEDIKRSIEEFKSLA